MMDFSAFLIIPLAGVVAVAVVIMSRWSSGIRKRPFLIALEWSFLLSVILLRPWEEMTLAEWPFLLLSLALVAVWAAGGTVFGMAVGMLLVRAASLVSGAFKRGK